MSNPLYFSLALLICAAAAVPSAASPPPTSTEWMQGKSPVPSPLLNFVASPAAVELNIHSNNFCKAAGIRCSDAGLAKCASKPYRRLLDAQLDGGILCVPHATPTHSRRFFRLAEFAPDSTVNFPQMYDAVATSFLPHHLSQQVPFGLEDVPDILELLRLQRAPVTKLFMVSTLSACGVAPSAIEEKKCTRSLKEMSDFVSKTLGSESPEVYASRDVEKLYGKMIRVREIKQLVPRTESHVACHAMAYPYLVHYCHSVKGTEVFSATIDHQGGSANVLLECHTITSYMKSTNSILTQLGLSPGEGEYCHFIESSAMIFARK